MNGPWHRKSPGYPNPAPSSLASGISRRGERPAHRADRAPVGIIRKAEEILLVDGLQNVHDGLLNDFVLQTQNAEWPLGAVRLRDACPSGWARPIAAPVHSIVQVFQFLFEGLSIGLPCHAIGSGRSVTREREIAPL